MPEGWNINKKTKIRLAAGILVILTLFRFYLGIKMPIYLRADTVHDEYLYVNYAGSILRGEWLGIFLLLRY